MPNAYDKLPEKMTKTLHQAVYNLKLDGDMFDGTYLAQPVIRAIDGHLKMLLLSFEIIPDWKYIKANGYDMFEKVGAKYRLCTDRYGKATAEQAKYVGNCYTFLIIIEISYLIGMIQQHLWIRLNCWMLGRRMI